MRRPAREITMTRILLASLVSFAITFPAAAQDAEELIKQLKSPEAKARRLAAEKLGRQKVEAAIPSLAPLLVDKDGDVRSAAADALVRIGPKAIPVLAGALGSVEEPTRLLAARSLAVFGAEAKPAVPALTAALKDKTVDVRIHAAYLLGLIGPDAKQALPALTEAAKDLGNMGAVLRKGVPSGVADAAVSAALKIDPACAAALAKAALADLAKGLKSENQGEVQTAAFAISVLGEHARPALPEIEAAAKRAKGFSQTTLENLTSRLKGEAQPKYEDVARDIRQPVRKRVEAIGILGWSDQPQQKILSVFVELLGDKEPLVRHSVAERLAYGKFRSKEAIAALIEHLDDEDLEAASDKSGSEGDMVPRALARMGKQAAAPLAAFLRDKDKKPVARFRAARALSLLGPAAAGVRDDLEATLGDRYLAVAVESAGAFVRAGGDFAKAEPVLQEGLRHKIPFMAWTATHALERIGPAGKGLVPELTAALKHPEREVRIVACRALSKMGPAAETAVPAMAALLKDKDRRQRHHVSDALDELGPVAKAAVPALVEQLNDLDRVSPNRVLSLLGKLGPDAGAAVPGLIRLLKAKDTFLGDQVMETLGRIGPAAKGAVPLMVEALGEKDDYRRAHAARALGEMGPAAEAAVPKLTEALDDPSKMVRVWAAFALARVTGKAGEYVGRIAECWDEPRGGKKDFGTVDFDVAQALERLGPAARPARELILRGLANPHTAPGTHHSLARAAGSLQGDADVVVPKLVALLDEQKVTDYGGPDRRVHVIAALGSFGPKAKAAAAAAEEPHGSRG
jgi:HEAT repeat protein